MKSYTGKLIIVAVLALVAGLTAGYFIFNRGPLDVMDEDHDHTNMVTDNSSEEQIWTCSMHPQIRRNEPGLCPICQMELIPLESSAGDDPMVLQMTTDAIKLANIQTTIVGQSEMQTTKTLRMTGKVQADERLASSQVSHIPGRIEKLYVSFTGEQIFKGQKLADIYSPDLISAQRELLEAIKLKDINSNLVEAARNKLRFWKISDNEITSIEKDGVIKETFPIYADNSGIVTSRRISVGDYVKQGQPLFDVTNLNKVWVLFDAYEEDFPNIKTGDRITFTTPSIPKKEFKTRVTFIDPVINPKTRVASVRTEVSNRNGSLKPEMLVYGTIFNNLKEKPKLTVPKSAVLWTGSRSVVYVKVPNTPIPSFKYREVEIGDALGTDYVLMEGLEIGEEIVARGSFTIDAAAQLSNQASMMNKNVTIKGTDQSNHLPDYTDSTPQPFKEQLLNLATTYLTLKDALVATSSIEAEEAGKNVLVSLNKVDMSLVKDDAHIYWMEQFNAIKAHTEKIAGSMEIEEQRKQFDLLSQAIIKSVKSFGIAEGTLYVQHCPMANDNKGADWLSSDKEIRNPYFGEKMLTCGLVKTTIDKAFKNPVMSKTSKPMQNVHNH